MILNKEFVFELANLKGVRATAIAVKKLISDSELTSDFESYEDTDDQLINELAINYILNKFNFNELQLLNLINLLL